MHPESLRVSLGVLTRCSGNKIVTQTVLDTRSVPAGRVHVVDESIAHPKGDLSRRAI